MQKKIQNTEYSLIVFSHLRWDFVFQRPQHLLTRFSKSHKVLFVEEPIKDDPLNKEGVNLIKVNENLTVMQPFQSLDNALLGNIIEEFSSKAKTTNNILWFYSAAFVNLAKKIKHKLIIYDCMDELSAFAGASDKLKEQEKKLLTLADIVFTGGKSLYEAKRKIHSNTYCFPSSVDRMHFEKANSIATNVPLDILSIKKPIVGYYGVIDERADLELLQFIAKKFPDISFVMIGPIVKIDENSLPKANNIHYLGARNYDDLPGYLKAIDIAIVPFALNISTEFISPTKTLEYMAALKPIVSTAIYDIARDYRKQIFVASNYEEFAKGINFYLNESEKNKQLRQDYQRSILQKTSWDNTYQTMEGIIKKTLKESNQSTIKSSPISVFNSMELTYKKETYEKV